MATFTKVLLSGSTQGKPIPLNDFTAPGTTIHTTGTSSSIIDEIWLWAFNVAADARNLRLWFGNYSGGGFPVELSVPANSGAFLVCSGWVLTGTGAAGNVVQALTTSHEGDVHIVGYVNRIS